MQKQFLALAACLFFASPAVADELSFDLTNKTGQVIKAISVTPRAGGAAIDVIADEIADGAKINLVFQGPASTCVFTINSTLASGKVLTKPDVFLCHRPELVIP